MSYHDNRDTDLVMMLTTVAVACMGSDSLV